MFSHVTVGAEDPGALVAFYDAVFAPLGIGRFFGGEDVFGWRRGVGEPAFYVGRPFDGAAAGSGNGWMAAFRAGDRGVVDACHGAALSHGGVCEGAPGIRLRYAADYYGAYFRDPAGNKLHVVHREHWGVIAPAVPGDASLPGGE